MYEKLFIGNNTVKFLRDITRKENPSKVCFITDENSYKFSYSLISEKLPPHNVITLKPGEDQKNIQTCTYVWKKMTEYLLDRHSLIINLGGGVICDLGGFCAATFKRGVNFVQCPTTLLSQVDASIGGKLGLNFNHYKNQIGLFLNPDYVIISNQFLTSLPLRELRSGHVEMIKHSLISSKKDWERQLSIDVTKVPPLERIVQSIEIKNRIVSKDQKEKNIRKKLNFGHTIGHAIEKLFLEKKKQITHGEAVAIGIIAESWLSFKRLGLSKDELIDITKYIKKNYSMRNLCDIDKKKFTETILQDKKNYDNTVLCSLLSDIGTCKVNIPVSTELCWESLGFYMDEDFS